MTTILTPKISKVSVVQDGTQVLVVQDGKAILELPWEAAQMLARALTIKANEAEQIAKVEQTIFDQAILFRTGAPFAFSADRRIVDQARVEAGWNTRLRRYIRQPNFERAGAIASKEKFGTPAVKDGE